MEHSKGHADILPIEHAIKEALKAGVKEMGMHACSHVAAGRERIKELYVQRLILRTSQAEDLTR